jgi:hypothetical protein
VSHPLLVVPLLHVCVAAKVSARNCRLGRSSVDGEDAPPDGIAMCRNDEC